jgi:hypothetical protein
MSFQSAIANLSAPTKDLVLKATANGTELLGETEADQASVNGWIEKAAQGDIVKEGNLKVRLLVRKGIQSSECWLTSRS